MIHKKPKLIKVAISDIVNDMTRNVREQSDAAYDLEPLIADLQMRGQQDAATLEIVNGKKYPLKGFRRVGAFTLASQRGLKYSETAPEAGKPMDHILAYVYEDLTERERTELLLDHGQRKGLSKVELQNAFERAFVAGYSEKEIVTLLYTLLVQHYPPDRVIGDGLEGEQLAAKRLEYYKGVLQTAKRAANAPTVLREAYYKKLRGEQKWPSNSELVDLLSIHNKEATENPLLSRDKPGPKFTEKFNAVKTARESSTGNAPKSASMRNRGQVEDSLKIMECPVSKVYLMIQLGDIPVDRLPIIDRMVNHLWESGAFTDDQKQEIASWFGKPKPDETKQA